jgi:hypothetical protein
VREAVRRLLLAFVAAIAGCALHTAGTGMETEPGTGGGATSTGGAATTATTSTTGSSSTTTGGGGSSTDGAPTGAVSFFQRLACPDGWAAYDAADGRAILPAMDPAAAGASQGTPLAPGEDRGHTHDAQASFHVDDFSFTDFSGGNGGVASSGDKAASFTTGAASGGLPYTRLLVCKKTAPPSATPLPVGAHLFFEGDACPAGWKQDGATRGRFLVGLPAGAAADKPFGAAASAGPFTHAHDASLTLATSSYGVAALSGCCNSGFGKNGTYSASSHASDAEAGLPYLTLIHCSKT